MFDRNKFKNRPKILNRFNLISMNYIQPIAKLMEIEEILLKFVNLFQRFDRIRNQFNKFDEY